MMQITYDLTDARIRQTAVVHFTDTNNDLDDHTKMPYKTVDN